MDRSGRLIGTVEETYEGLFHRDTGDSGSLYNGSKNLGPLGKEKGDAGGQRKEGFYNGEVPEQASSGYDFQWTPIL